MRSQWSNRSFRNWVVSLPFILSCAAYAQGPAAVVTGQYNNSRTGGNQSETTLAPSNVSASTFGLLFTQPVDGNVFAQPLYVPNLTISGAVHNVVLVATFYDTVYAFDADTAQPPLWQTSLGNPATVLAVGLKMGILSTPVIDTNTNTLFAATLTGEGGNLVFRLHALNLLTGAEITNVVVQAAVSGTGDDSQSTPCSTGNGGTVAPPCIPFNAGRQLQRPALLEDSNSTIYLAFGTASGLEAEVPYHGWLIGYQYAAGTFTQTLVFNSTPTGTQSQPPCSSTVLIPSNQCGHAGGIWMSGRGPALDATGIFVVVGNGGYGGAASGNWGESALRLNSAGVVQDSFTPANWATLNVGDLDLGDAGAILFSSTNATIPNLLLAGGKTGVVYVMNRASLGGSTPTDAGVLQKFTGTSAGCGNGPGASGCYEIHSPVLWSRTGVGTKLYIWAWGDLLRVWDFNETNNQFQLDSNEGTIIAANYPGAALALSSNGNSDGLIWATITTSDTNPAQGALYAFDATNVSTPLWTSTDYWFSSKYALPTIGNGKVYVGTSSSPSSVSPAYQPMLRVYGLCGGCAQAAPDHAANTAQMQRR